LILIRRTYRPAVVPLAEVERKSSDGGDTLCGQRQEIPRGTISVISMIRPIPHGHEIEFHVALAEAIRCQDVILFLVLPRRAVVIIIISRVLHYWLSPDAIRTMIEIYWGEHVTGVELSAELCARYINGFAVTLFHY